MYTWASSWASWSYYYSCITINSFLLEHMQEKQGVKIGLVGEQGVGKTHIVNEYLLRRTPENPASTIAVEFATTIYTLRDGTSVKVEIWDTAGHERYKDIVCVHLRDADGIVFVYDIQNQKSFEAISVWMEKVRKECSPKVHLMMFANKVDLVEHKPERRRVTMAQAQTLAKQKAIGNFYQTSVYHPEVLHSAINDFLEEIVLDKCQESLEKRMSMTAPSDAYCNKCMIF